MKSLPWSFGRESHSDSWIPNTPRHSWVPGAPISNNIMFGNQTPLSFISSLPENSVFDPSFILKRFKKASTSDDVAAALTITLATWRHDFTISSLRQGAFQRGPVRCQCQMRSHQPWGRRASSPRLTGRFPCEKQLEKKLISLGMVLLMISLDFTCYSCSMFFMTLWLRQIPHAAVGSQLKLRSSCQLTR